MSQPSEESSATRRIRNPQRCAGIIGTIVAVLFIVFSRQTGFVLREQGISSRIPISKEEGIVHEVIADYNTKLEDDSQTNSTTEEQTVTAPPREQSTPSPSKDEGVAGSGVLAPNEEAESNYTAAGLYPDDLRNAADYDLVRPQLDLQNLVGKCPSWSRAFTERFASTCGFWYNMIKDWEVNVLNTTREVTYKCHGGACGGWGDQLAGMITSFARALTTGARFRISHKIDAQKLLNPCLLQATSFLYDNGTATLDYNSSLGACSQSIKSEPHCPRAFPPPDCEKALLTDTNRMCFPHGTICDGLARASSHVTTANAIGCVARIISEPSKWLRKQPVSFRMGEMSQNGSKIMTLHEAEEFISTNVSIAIHLRIGDRVFSSPDPTTDDLNSLRNVLKCASTMDSYFVHLEELKGTAKRSRKWLFSSDSAGLTRVAHDLEPERLVTFANLPKHAESVSGSDASTLMEWYLFGSAQSFLISGKFQGRYSGFSRTSVVMHLKHLVFNAETCVLSPIGFVGNWGSLGKDEACVKHMINGTELAQDHLYPITSRGLKFPNAWVSEGKLLSDQPI